MDSPEERVQLQLSLKGSECLHSFVACIFLAGSSKRLLLQLVSLPCVLFTDFFWDDFL